MDQNVDQLLHVQGDRAQLEDQVTLIDAGIVKQSYFLSQYQQATRDVEDAQRLGRELLTRIKNAIRAFYGLRSEKLQEFGLTVRRFVRRLPKEKPPETSLTPSPAAASETDGAIQK